MLCMSMCTEVRYRCWDEVTTCSKSCNHKRKAGAKSLRAGGKDPVETEEVLESYPDKRKLVKEKRRMKRQGLADDNAGQKPCHLCNQGVDLLIRCQIDESKAWRMVCGKCWPSISGGVADGTLEFPHYRYGGLWKSR